MIPEGFKTAFQLLKEEEKDEVVSTGVEPLDSALKGSGLKPGSIYELVGQSSVGKSQLCFQLSVSATMNRRRRGVLYIDTEGSFRTERIVQIARARDPSVDDARLLGAIKHCRCTDAVEMSSALNQALKLAGANPRFGLVVIDSIAFPIRVESESKRRRELVESVAQQILKLALELRCIVVVVNQVTTTPSGKLTSALGSSWSHRCTVRMWMTVDERGSKFIEITKSPFDERQQIMYRITTAGVESSTGDCDQEMPQ